MRTCRLSQGLTHHYPQSKAAGLEFITENGGGAGIPFRKA
ncbi:hypothetical protein SAMN05192568_105526 [Methylobacterium pseudosasicola]|uniref:Uncharacterized protein n=1 Tax=Methylobacterium pseudosasicola TaxID=582667 RepID=A0A1I4TLU8_9HYPH|nr:hypothetical protein SAMN05192568_105526 [Methylobacterium pseudosasicola]